MKLCILTDSGSDIPADYRDDVVVLPLTIMFGTEAFLDGETLSHQEFYERLIESDTLPTTSQITPYQYQEKMEALLQNYDGIVVVALSSKLSGTFESAVAAAANFEGKVRVVDSLSATIGQRILIEYGIRLIEQGKTLDQVADELESARERVRIVALIDTLEYLKKGGRISPLASVAGGLLSLKPVITLTDGAVSLLGAARGSKRGNNYLVQQIDASGGINFDMPYYLGYTGLTDVYLQKYIRDSAHLYEGKTDDLPIMSVGGAIGTHIGPGALAVAYFSNDA